MTYLAYAESIEKPEANEVEAIDGIIKGMSEQTQTVAEREGHAVRASHAKGTACAVGELTVSADLPSELAQGLFAKTGTYPVAVRFAQGPGETLGDRVSMHRGIAIKVFGVEGEKLPGHDVDTQDFVLASGTTFPSGTAQGFLRDAKQIGATVSLPEGFKSAVSAAARNFNKYCMRSAPSTRAPTSSAMPTATHWPTPISANVRSASAPTSPSSAPFRRAPTRRRCKTGGSIPSRTRTAFAMPASPSCASTARPLS